MSTTATPLAAATALQPLLRAAGADIERERRLGDAVLDALHDMGAFHLQLAAAYGGPAADPLIHLATIEALARGDASAGWCAMVGAESSACINAWLAPDTIRAMFATPRPAVACLTAVGTGRARAVPDGYRVSGRWRFASGCRHSSWLGGLAVVLDGETPRLREGGAPDLRMLFVPASAATLLDTWHTSGLKGTASDDFTLDDCFVPETHAFDLFGAARDPAPAWRLPAGLRFAMSKGAAVCGMALAAMDAVLPLLDRVPFAGVGRAARDEARVHLRLAEAEGAIESGRAYLYREVERAWCTVDAGGTLDLRAIAGVRLAVVTAARHALDAVNIVQELAGTAAIFDATLDRAARDLQVARHHLQLQPHVSEDIGRVLLGLGPRNAMF